MGTSGGVMPFEERLLSKVRFLEDSVVVALSGGADSAYLLWAAIRSGVRPRAVHVHHGLPASDALAGAAAAVGARLDCPVESIRVRVPDGPSPEGAARDVRYSALLGSLRPGEFLATGHTASDQAETVMAALLRGSGLDGMRGIPRRRGRIIRPLLDVTRSETRAAAERLGLPWLDDPSNLDLRLFRNRIRHRLLPLIEREYRAGIGAVLTRSADVAAMEAAALDRSTPREAHPGEGRVRLVVGELLAVDDAFSARAIRRAVAPFLGDHPPGKAAVDRIMSVARGRSRAAEVTAGVTARVEGPWLMIEMGGGGSAWGAVDLAVPGSTHFGDYRVECVVRGAIDVYPLSPWATALPWDTDRTLRIRVPRPGDAVVVGGRRRDVVDLLEQSRVPSHRRRIWPVVVTSEDEIVWVPGIRRPGQVSAATTSSRYLCAVVVQE